MNEQKKEKKNERKRERERERERERMKGNERMKENASRDIVLNFFCIYVECVFSFSLHIYILNSN